MKQWKLSYQKTLSNLARSITTCAAVAALGSLGACAYEEATGESQEASTGGCTSRFAEAAALVETYLQPRAPLPNVMLADSAITEVELLTQRDFSILLKGKLGTESVILKAHVPHEPRLHRNELVWLLVLEKLGLFPAPVGLWQAPANALPELSGARVAPDEALSFIVMPYFENASPPEQAPAGERVLQAEDDFLRSMQAFVAHLGQPLNLFDLQLIYDGDRYLPIDPEYWHTQDDPLSIERVTRHLPEALNLWITTTGETAP